MTRPSLHSLLERVRSAEKGSRELDAEIAVALTGAEAPLYPQAHHPGVVIRDGKICFSPPVSTSLDAVVSLIEKELPGWFYRVGHSTLHLGWANVYREHPNNTQPGDGEFFSDGRTPSLALLAALLSAKLSMEEDNAEA